jgi:hypothetical protein
MRAAEGGRSTEPIKTYVRVKPRNMDEISLVASNTTQVFVQKHNLDPF